MKYHTWGDYAINSFLMLLAVITVSPFYNVFITSFADPAAIVKQQFYLLPTSFSLVSYKLLLNGAYVGKALANSVIITVAGTLVNMLVTACGAYALSKKTMPGPQRHDGRHRVHDAVRRGLIPYYLTIKSLHLINSYSVMILPVAVNTFFLIILINHFRSIPPSWKSRQKWTERTTSSSCSASYCRFRSRRWRRSRCFTRYPAGTNGISRCCS
ncbi:hypothetical protein LJK88_26175 [Paenibacillus sp. P26]|nr:hypothetical protein LJK88_26175 [Paenibacillus sp. P26]